MSEFTLLSPAALFLLLLLIPVQRYLRAAQRSRSQVQEKLGGAAAPSPHRLWPTLLALALVIIGLARPGFSPTPRGISQGGRDLIFALDVSRSMLARDAKPSRLEKAKADIRACLARNPAARVALIVFAGSATVKAPLSVDHDFMHLAVEHVGPSSVAQGSTFLQAVFEKVGDRLLVDDRRGYQDIILLTDGEDQGSQVDAAAAALAEKGVRLLVLGYGDTTIGARIPLVQQDGSLKYVTEKGQDVWTRLQESGLQTTASDFADGRYLRATRNDMDLAATYREWIAEAPLQPITVAGDLVYRELYPYLLGLAALLLLPLSLPRGLRKPALVLAASILCAAEEPASDWELRFGEAIKHLNDEQFMEAHELLDQLAAAQLANLQLAACLYHQALCCAQLCDASGAALEQLQWSQQGLDAISRVLLLLPRQPAAQQLLEGLVLRCDRARKAYEEEQERQHQINKALAAIIEALRIVVEQQSALAHEGNTLLPQRNRNRKPVTPPPPIPADFPARQQATTTLTQPIRDNLSSLRDELAEALRSSQNLPKDLSVPTELDEPAKLVESGHQQQRSADENLPQPAALHTAVAAQQKAREHLQAALDALEGNSSMSDESEGEGDEWDEEDYEDWEMSDSDSSSSQSAAMTGGASRTDYVNRDLPTPDYSVQDLLDAERENSQERAKKHAAQSGNVEKNW